MSTTITVLPPGGKWPARVIFDAWDALDNFKKAYERITNHPIHPLDLEEIVTQVLSAYLNNNLDDIEHLGQLPDFNRMREIDFSGDAMLAVEQATTVLGFELAHRIQELGIHYQGEFPYAFERFVGRDIVLMHIPY